MNAPEQPPAGQLDLAGDVDERARYDDVQGERMRLFEPAPAQIAGQTYLQTDSESEER